MNENYHLTKLRILNQSKLELTELTELRIFHINENITVTKNTNESEYENSRLAKLLIITNQRKRKETKRNNIFCCAHVYLSWPMVAQGLFLVRQFYSIKEILLK